RLFMKYVRLERNGKCTGSNGKERAATGKNRNKRDLQPIQASNQKTNPEYKKNLRKHKTFPDSRFLFPAVDWHCLF
ncbi:MAG TPA: hypothetical protein VJY36_00595, partial [Candidatus Bathyarchaeia archaeon]|nr:hypothetical protein [Candidatus Bathyarchaeia archaeon]